MLFDVIHVMMFLTDDAAAMADDHTFAAAVLVTWPPVILILELERVESHNVKSCADTIRRHDEHTKTKKRNKLMGWWTSYFVVWGCMECDWSIITT